MTPAELAHSASPFTVLADYERRSLAHEAGAPEQIEAKGQWRGIGFRVGQHRFLGSIKEIGELLVMPTLTMVPGTRAWVLGVANVRGNLVPIMDLNQFLFATRTQQTDRSRVVLVRQPGTAIGLLVDEVLGQRSLVEEQRDEMQEEQDERLQSYVVGNIQLGEQRWGIFSMASLIEASEFQQAAV